GLPAVCYLSDERKRHRLEAVVVVVIVVIRDRNRPRSRKHYQTDAQYCCYQCAFHGVSPHLKVVSIQRKFPRKSTLKVPRPSPPFVLSCCRIYPPSASLRKRK